MNEKSVISDIESGDLSKSKSLLSLVVLGILLFFVVIILLQKALTSPKNDPKVSSVVKPYLFDHRNETILTIDDNQTKTDNQAASKP